MFLCTFSIDGRTKFTFTYYASMLLPEIKKTSLNIKSYLYLINSTFFNAQILIMSTTCQGKGSWPELVGARGTTAAATIERENPRVDAIVVVDGTVVTTEFRCDRVWVWVNSNGVVVRAPVIG
ncbi:hypothetical protein QVD17_17217 [Tagetes erecta]|uniref:Uncharacterized protein n=1 Tax=Tagetes erecta TaxID=13708 RepID=A0AAD8KRW5_TARER|nr:hypothetical protein QVD17_17217 [Tagetes erecta]